MQLKEPVIIWRSKGWIVEWEKESHKKNDAVLEAMFVNKYQGTVFDLPDAGKNTLYVGENEKAREQGFYGGWTFHGVCYVDGVEDEKLTLFLAIIEMPAPGSNEEKVWGSDEYDNT